jgi:quercetin dioxygenase-like cupin family protein
MQPHNSQTQQWPSGSLLPTPVVTPARSVELDIERELEELRCNPEWQSGIARKTLIRFPDFQITLRRMKANTRIPEHHNSGRICVQTIVGHLRMHADGKTFDLPQGKCLVLDHAVTHDVEAIEESAFLLTVASEETTAR